MRIILTLFAVFAAVCSATYPLRADESGLGTTEDSMSGANLVCSKGLVCAKDEAEDDEPEVEMKYLFVGKLKKSEKYFAGWGAAKGKFPTYRLTFKIIEVRNGNLKVGESISGDQSATPYFKTQLKAANLKVGEKYLVGSPLKHPGYSKGIYLQEFRLSKLPSADEEKPSGQ